MDAERTDPAGDHAYHTEDSYGVAGRDMVYVALGEEACWPAGLACTHPRRSFGAS